MIIWLLTVGEPLPLPGMTARRWRTSLLSAELQKRGHEVVWWTSTIDHFSKQLLFKEATRVRGTDGSDLRFLHGVRYTRNVSAARLLNHWQIGRGFRAAAEREDRKPDAIVCSFPTIELSKAAVEYGLAHDVPVVVDVRDLWPDIFLDVAPTWARGLVRWVLATLFSQTRFALTNCAAITGVSEKYRDWGLKIAGRSQRSLDRVIPLGYERTSPTEADRRAIALRLVAGNIEARHRIAVFSGTFGRTYDLKTVIDAARQMRDAGDDQIRFLLCGSGDRDAEWRARAADLQNVLFTGWLAAGELAALMEGSWVGLAAYERNAPQSIPNKVIEYMASGLPVVSSLQGETATLLETSGCGRTYVAGDSSSLRGVLRECARSDENARLMGRQSMALFERSFAAARVYADMADLVEKLSLSGSAGPTA